METTLSSKITPLYAGKKLIDFLSSRFKYHSQIEWRNLILEGKVMLNNEPAAPEAILSIGDIVSYHVILNEPPVNTNIRIVYEDEYFVIASKPANLPSHADGNFITHTFVYLLNEMMGKQHAPYKLVNRLDRETSGLIVASNNSDAHKNLSRQFETSKVQKEYIAIVRGEIDQDNFIVDGPIVSDPHSRISIRRAVGISGSPGAREAKTVFEVIERLCGYTVVRCIPQSGRTAQIRVHLAHAGYPLAGDKLYGRSDDEFLEYVARVRSGNYDLLPWMDAPRHMLHAHRLSFNHPAHGMPVSFTDPLPEDMQLFVEEKRATS